MSCCFAPELLPFPPKDPLDTLDYGIDFSGQVNLDGDSLTTLIGVTSTPGGLTIATPTLVGNIAYGWVSGGVAGVTYILDFEVMTAKNRTYNRGGTLLVTPL
jgi:hypothetical protein